MTEQALRSLFDALSQEEKIGQLLQLEAGFFAQSDFQTGPAAALGLQAQDAALCGSVLNLRGAEEAKAVQERFIRQHPHHIPLLLMLDVINGYETVFPIPLAQACSFRPELTQALCAAAAREASADGLHVTFSPMADLAADCRWGRVMESSGEDPLLCAAFAAAAVRGYQGDDLTHGGTLAACGKHFAGYGAPLAGSEYAQTELSPATFQSDYLSGYRACIDAGSKLMMTAFNTVDGIPASGSKPLLRGVLRGQLGFAGLLISDYSAIAEMIRHGYAEDRRAAARLALEAGVDMEMVGVCYVRELDALVRDGTISQCLIDEAAWRVLKLKNDLGLFEDPYRGADAEIFRACALENRALAAQAAAETFVLLKNEDDLLPLRTQKVAFIGPYAESRALHGAWSFFCREADTVSIRQGVEALGKTAAFCKGAPLLAPGAVIPGFSANYVESETEQTQTALLREAVRAASAAETVVLCLGEQRLQSGEGGSRTEPVLPAPQMQLLRAVHDVNPNIVLVLFAGRPLVLRDVLPLCKSLLYVWFPGSMGGAAIAEVLYGRKEPVGRLSMSFPASIGQCPVSYRTLNTGRPEALVPTGRFHNGYQDCPSAPLFPFGFGLSYSTWQCGPLTAERAAFAAGERLVLTCTVRNTGSRTGRTVLQLYLQDVCANVCRPRRELKSWRHVTLAPGEEAAVAFEVTEQMLQFYGPDGMLHAEPGEFHAYAGFDSGTQNACTFYFQ